MRLWIDGKEYTVWNIWLTARHLAQFLERWLADKDSYPIILQWLRLHADCIPVSNYESYQEGSVVEVEFSVIELLNYSLVCLTPATHFVHSWRILTW